MKQDIKNKEFRKNQEYVSPSVKLIEVTAQRVICTSGDWTETPGLSPDSPYSF